MDFVRLGTADNDRVTGALLHLVKVAFIGDRNEGLDKVRANVLQDRSEHAHVVWSVDPGAIAAHFNKTGMAINKA